MVPPLSFFRHVAAVSRVARTDISGTIHATKAWTAVASLAAVPVAYQPRGPRAVQTPTGIMYAEYAEAWVEEDELATAGPILEGDRMAITYEGESVGKWEVEAAPRVEDAAARRVQKLTLVRVLEKT